MSGAQAGGGGGARSGGAGGGACSGEEPARPVVGWSDLRGARVGLFGLRAEGAASLRRLRRMGVVPVLVDDRPSAPTFGGLRVLTGDEGLRRLAGCDVVVKTPGISRYASEVTELVRAGVTLCGGLGLWLVDADRSRVVCVTGTKGKSTTAALAGHLLRGLGRRCLVAGNIGVPPWDPDVANDAEVTVVETSSFQATDVPVSPPVVAVTSLAPDHLDWHGTVERYYADKLSLCAQPGASLSVADGTSAELRARRTLLGPRVRWVEEGDTELDGSWVDVLGLPGRHMRRDALIARGCLVGLGIEEAGDAERIAQAAAGFHGLAHRFASLGALDGVEFIDDSLSTNVLPAVAALDALGGRALALIVGGHDRGIDYGDLADAVVARSVPREGTGSTGGTLATGGAPATEGTAATYVATLPSAGQRIGQAVRDAVLRAGGGGGVESGGGGGSGVRVEDFEDLETATAASFRWARERGGVVLLSPAAPSFGQFRDYEARSLAFRAAMARCAGSDARLAPERSPIRSAEPDGS